MRTAQFLALLCALLVPAAGARGQQQPTLGSADRARGRTMLRAIRREVETYYYDSTFRGIDLDAHFRAAENGIAAASSNSEVFTVIAQTLLDFNDSHLLFIPPEFAARVDYGWSMSAVGDSVYITDVAGGSDAESKGLAVGDLVHAVNGHRPTRDNAWLIQYMFGALRPQPGLRVVVQRPGREPTTLDLAARVIQGRQLMDLRDPRGSDVLDLMLRSDEHERRHRHRFLSLGDSVLVWKAAAFGPDRDPFDEVLKQLNRHRSLVLDLRGNGGGAEETLLHTLGRLFPRDVAVGTTRQRTGERPLVAKGSGEKAFRGTVVVLVDAGSASAAELAARTVQLQRRGTVVGDRTAGRVMRSWLQPLRVTGDRVWFYCVSVTNADIVMPDGGRLEGHGVVPDERVLPSGADLAARRDPAMARALALAGYTVTPAQAGTLFAPAKD